MSKRLLLLLLCLSLYSKGIAQSPSPASKFTADAILTEIGRLKNLLSTLKVSSDEQQSYNTLLSRSERAAQAGHLFLSLHLLQYAAPTLGAYEFRQTREATVQVGPTAFEQEWKRVGTEIIAQQRKLTATTQMPMAVQAVVERSLTQVQPNYQASLPYGQEAGIESGLFYLGLAKAQLDFVAFCRRLKFESPRPATLRSPASELNELEKEVLEAYRQFDTPEKHGTFIRVNSQLKIAQDLARERRTSGVWLQVLEARRALVALPVTNTKDSNADELQQQSAAVRAQLARAFGDQSLGWLYWQMVEAALSANDLQQANAILQHVLPRYFKAQTKNR